MRYLRMLVNSIAAAGLAAAFVIVVVLLLNPSLSFGESLVPLVATVGVFYAVSLTIVFYVLLLLRHLLARVVFSPAWISVGALVWLCAISATAGAALMWRNLSTFGQVLDPDSAAALDRSALALTAAAVLCVGLAELRRRFPERRVIWAALLVLVTMSSVAAPLAFRGAGARRLLEARPIDAAGDVPLNEASAHVTLIAIDGASLDFITRATAEGRLPNFGRLLDAGAVRHLATLHPTTAGAVWAAVATGKLPQKNGVRSASIYQMPMGGGSIQLLPDFCYAYRLVRMGVLTEQPHSSATLRTRTLWSILGNSGFSVGVVAWPLTQPAPVVRGYLVSDAFFRAASDAAVDESPTVYPPEIQAEALSATQGGMTDGEAVVPTSLGDLTGAGSRQDGPARVDRMYDRIGRELAQARPTHVTMMRYQSLDTIGHYFLRYAMPSEFGDVSEDEHQRLGAVVERQYGVLDEAIGRAMASVGPDDVLLVVSGYGMEPLGPGKRLVERLIGDPDISGTHDDAPDGFLLAYGSSVARGRQLQRASVVDIVPTILYFLGLPIGRDMDGYARTDLFVQSFTQDHAIAYIPTYDR